MSDNMKIYNAVRECPRDALGEIEGGRLKGKFSIDPMWRIEKLTELFGACGVGWYYEITRQWLEKSDSGEIAAFCNINLYVKINGEWSKPIVGTGGSSFAAIQKSGLLYVCDECFKMALTDAISVSCKALGFAADVYWKNNIEPDKSKEKNKKPGRQNEYRCVCCGRAFTGFIDNDGKEWTPEMMYEEAVQRRGKAICAICYTAQEKRR